MPIPKFIKGYVRIPFPPAYSLACIEIGFPDEGPVNTVTNGLHSPQTTYSVDEIELALKGESEELKGVLRDVPRTGWKLGESAKETLDTQQLQTKSNEVGLALTLDEAKALSVFACTVRSESSSKCIWAQGGLFDFPCWSVFSFWLLRIGNYPGGTTDAREHYVTREAKNKLNVLFYIQLDSFSLHQDNQVAEINFNRPLLIYSNQYVVNKNRQNFTCTRLDDPENCALFIDAAFFYNYLIPVAEEKLQKINFAAKLNEESKKNLLFLIPLLSHYKFAKLFYKQLQGTTVEQRTTIEPETREFLLKHIKLCFDEPTFWQRHQSKILGVIIALIVVAIITTPPLAVFGLPAVMAAMGGVLLFGYFMALGGSFLAVLGGGLGSVIDDERMQSFDLIQNMTRSIEGYCNDDIAPDRSSISEFTVSHERRTEDDVYSQKVVSQSGTKINDTKTMPTGSKQPEDNSDHQKNIL